MSRLYLVVAAVLAIHLGVTVAEPLAIQCYECQGSTCDDEHLVRCPSAFQACQTVVSQGHVKKGCKSIIECWRAAQKGCKDGTCSYCCDSDHCNSDIPTEAKQVRGPVEVRSSGACDPNPCHNGGTCEELDDGATCGTKTGKSCKEKSQKTEKSKKAKREERTTGNKRAGLLKKRLLALRGKAAAKRDTTLREIQREERSSGGEFVCHCEEGYYGTYCEHYDAPAPNPCESSPCHNGGTCHSDDDGYWCQCAPGYVGYNCESPYYPCDSNPCRNGGTCNNDGNSYWCQCHPGYEGRDCETAISPCDSHPCHNGGTCHQDDDQYWCECQGEYEGRHCETVYDPCNPNPCYNGGSCAPDDDNSRGEHFNKIIPFLPIGSHSIHHREEKRERQSRFFWMHSGRSEEFVCTCPDGYYGKLCETNRDPCDPNPCLNGGTCLYDSGRFFGKRGNTMGLRRKLLEVEEADLSLPGNDDYLCSCEEGYHGEHCEHITTPCTSHPCHNGGTCNHDGNDYWCTCTPGYEGDDCQTKTDPCDPNPCQNGGTCDEDRGIIGRAISLSRGSDNYFKCRCERGFYGDYCEIPEDPCDPSPCHNGGTCEIGESEESHDLSVFEPIFSKKRQERKKRTIFRDSDESADNTESRSSIGSSESNEGYHCRCQEGYYGRHCDEVGSPCSSAPCQHGGICHEDGNGHWCECPPGYAGSNCQIPIDPCTPNPCQNGGTCHNHGEGTFVCECPDNYAGAYCELPTTPVHPCNSMPCQNGGTCHDDDHGGYYCTCELGYGGRHCEDEYSDVPEACESSPCHNGGSCYDNGDGGYYCECRSGYEGHNCESETAPPPHEGYNCETNNPCTQENIDNGDLYWPHDDPSKFVQCDLWGQCFVMDCPPGLIWNQEIWECVRP